MLTTSASVIIGNPTMPCTGKGVCEMQATNISSNLAFNVNISSKGSDLTINIPVESLNDLEKVRPDIYENLTSDTPNFNFDGGALPFWIDYYISKEIFPSTNGYNKLDDKTTCNVTKQGDGSVNINFPQVTLNADGKDYGSTGSIDGEFLTTGDWKIGQDAYFNLVFMNTRSNAMFVFGSGGSISCNRYSVKLSNYDPKYSPTENYKTLIGFWKIGIDPAGNLSICSSLGGCNVVFALTDVMYSAIELVNLNLYTVGAFLADSQLNTSDNNLGTGDWAIQQDTNGNLCFKNGVCSYFFTTDGVIYVSTSAKVVTNYPLGG